jgi:hypothetical protein
VRRFVALVALTVLAGTLGARAHSAPPLHVFVLAGQSNMVGRGVGQPSPSNPRLLAWRGGWKVAADPLGSDAEAGIGPGMTFGLQVLRRVSGNIGLVMCAVGGTSIADWQPEGDLYRSCAAQVNAAGGHVDGVLFLQGEADARETRAQALAWPAAFDRVQYAFRRDFGGTFVLGQIGSLDPATFAYQQVVRVGQARMAKLLGLPLVRSADLPTAGGHFTVAAYRVLGARFATAWWRAQR